MSIVRVNHTKVSSAAEGADSTKVRTSDWNANLTLTYGPAFRVGRITSNQTLPDGTSTKVQFNSEVFDTDNAFDSTTNFRFTPQVAGIYEIKWGVLIAGNLLNVEASLRKNNVADTRGSQLVAVSAAGVTFFLSTGSTLVAMNGSSDYLEIFAAAYTVGSVGSNIGFGTDQVYFSGHFDRP